MYLFQELNIMELGFAKDKFIQFPTGQVPVGHESCGTVWTSPWQNQFHDIEFLEEAFSDITVLNFKVFKKYIFDFFVNLEKTCEINWIWTPLGGKWKILNHLSPGGKPLGDEWKA